MVASHANNVTVGLYCYSQKLSVFGMITLGVINNELVITLLNARQYMDSFRELLLEGIVLNTLRICVEGFQRCSIHLKSSIKELFLIREVVF